ncbi:MAG TPA: c-type cytochrome [Acidimicrobiia bacterium]|nr:c-type cytochrome [Acidimicrobiia bacterium]
MAGGREIFPTCAACHGVDGTGGAGPALTSVRDTFPDCDTHIEWIRLGSERWKAEVGPAYGSQDKPVDHVMPPFGHLDDQSLGRIAMYERVRFGGGDPDAERGACGLS